MNHQTQFLLIKFVTSENQIYVMSSLVLKWKAVFKLLRPKCQLQKKSVSILVKLKIVKLYSHSRMGNNLLLDAIDANGFR